MIVNIKGFVLLLLAGTMLLFSSCDIDPVAPSETSIVNVEDDFKINFFETLRETKVDRIFTLGLESIELFNCENYTIQYATALGGGVSAISINDIIEPSDCIEGEGPAIAFPQLAHLKEGVHDFKIILKNSVENEGTISITADKIAIEMASTDGLSFDYTEMLRIPENTIWGYYAYEDDAQDIAEKFETELKSIATEFLYTKGFYGQFSVDDNAELNLDVTPSYANMRKFFLSYEDNDNRLQNFISAQSALQNFEIKVFTSSGKEY